MLKNRDNKENIKNKAKVRVNSTMIKIQGNLIIIIFKIIIKSIQKKKANFKFKENKINISKTQKNNFQNKRNLSQVALLNIICQIDL
jgi:hypothetical protein